ncbi:MAG TPA: efflux RND transporter permease subunit, partial [Myxococcota bacterium]|nr:efflux RND transporter permease subunit [Myxococcota bacterium]
GTELFPRVDAGEMQLRIRAPAGTGLERTTELVRAIERIVREEAGEGHVAITLANIGNPAWTFPVNAVYVFNAGPHEATLMVALQGSGRPPVRDLEGRLRARFHSELPEMRVSFEPGDIVSRVMSFGASAPVHVSITGKSLQAIRKHAETIRDALAVRTELSDVQIPMALDYPTMHVEIDRERAALLGLDAQSIGRSLVTATSSTILTTPLFWTDPASGNPYRVALRVPEREMRGADDVATTPVGDVDGSVVTLGQVAAVYPTTTPGEVDRYNNQRTVVVTANVAEADLGTATRVVADTLVGLPPPKGIAVAVHGQAEQLQTTMASLRTGLLLTVIIVLLLLVAAFQSIRDAAAVLVTTPAVFVGVALALFLTGGTWNVQSLIGTIMAIGVSMANAVLLVTFARDRLVAGDQRLSAAASAAVARLRPIVMTSIAMVAGMLPIALAIGEGGEQTSPLGRAVIGGLLASTVATLFVLPAAYAQFAQRRYRDPSLLETTS